MMNDESGAVYPPLMPDRPEWVPPAKGVNVLADKTIEFALGVIAFYGKLPSNAPAQIMGRQLLRCGTSVGAQYREACRARSVAEFISKNESALQEIEESLYWLELIKRSGCAPKEPVDELGIGAEEILRLFVASVRTAKARAGRAGPAKS
jgi:four helix bundle protein